MKTIDTAPVDATDRALATSLFDALVAETSDTVGISRESFGPGEEVAIALVRDAARSHGLSTELDAGANLVVSLPGRESETPFVACGSHLDSVPQGGNFDGAAGVVAGLLCLARIHREDLRPRRNVKLIALRGEESAWYGKSCVGSSALLGKLAPVDLDSVHRAGGRTLAEAMAAAGADVERIARGEPLVDPAAFAGFLELHIEQGPVMVARDLPTAVVTGIRGNIRHLRAVCRGQAGHSGAVPRWLRRDPVFAVAELIATLDEHWRVLLERGEDLVVTFGIVGTDAENHSASRIPGEVAFSFEVRSQSVETLEAFYELMRTECGRLETGRKVAFEFGRRIDSAPALADPGWVERLLRISSELGLPTETVPSGAGHDAAVFANAGVPSAMVFVRNRHGSHNPDEAMEMDDFLAGTEILYRALAEAP